MSARRFNSPKSMQYSKSLNSCSVKSPHQSDSLLDASESNPHSSIKYRVSVVVRFTPGASALRRAVGVAAKIESHSFS